MKKFILVFLGSVIPYNVVTLVRYAVMCCVAFEGEKLLIVDYFDMIISDKVACSDLIFYILKHDFIDGLSKYIP